MTQNNVEFRACLLVGGKNFSLALVAQKDYINI